MRKREAVLASSRRHADADSLCSEAGSTVCSLLQEQIRSAGVLKLGEQAMDSLDTCEICYSLRRNVGATLRSATPRLKLEGARRDSAERHA